MKSFTYLIIDISCILIPFIASFYAPNAFYKVWKSFFKSVFLVGLFFLIWDEYFTTIGVWGFNEDYLTGVQVGHLPIEEILFFISIPYACVFSYYMLKYLVKDIKLKEFSTKLTLALILGSLILVGFNYSKWYTGSTFILLSLLLLMGYMKKVDFTYYYLTFLMILPFFFISNGILTGTGLASPIVWYNDQENLGLRMGTIPVEDTFYGMILIFMNIYLFDSFRQKKGGAQ